MIKKVLFGIFLFFGISASVVLASVGSLVKVNGKYYDSLSEAIANASENDIITLISDVKLTDTMEINKKVNIDLNGNDITADERVFLVQGGTLNITGKGTIKETKPNYGAIMVKGSTDPGDRNYSVLSVSKDVILEGWSGIFITHDNNKSYGVDVDFAGTIKAVDDTSGGTGAGIYVNGNIKDLENAPVVNILDGAKITSTGNGLYIAGYTTVNINEADISGVESGIGIKAGILNIDGATIRGTGPDETPTEGFNNGIKASGTAIQMESNSGYAGDIELNIDDGSFISDNSNVIYEYIGKGTNSQVVAMDISGGNFVSNASKAVVVISDSLKNFHNSFIRGGEYSSDPTEFLKSGYSAIKEDNMYVVTSSTLKDVFLNSDGSRNNSGGIVITIVLLISMIVVIYFNRYKILKVFNK